MAPTYRALVGAAAGTAMRGTGAPTALPAPRYLLPDYALLLTRDGDPHGRGPARTAGDALEVLLAAYPQVPARAGRPRPLGRIDALLAPVLPPPPATGADLEQLLTRFWHRLHALAGPGYLTVGPGDGPVARVLLRIAATEPRADAARAGHPPRLVLRVDPELTPDELIAAALAIPVTAGGPLLAADAARPPGIGPDHALADTGIRLPTGGGAYGLVRFDLLAGVLQHRGGLTEYLDRTLPEQLDLFARMLAAGSARAASAPDLLAGTVAGRRGPAAPRTVRGGVRGDRRGRGRRPAGRWR